MRRMCFRRKKMMMKSRTSLDSFHNKALNIKMFNIFATLGTGTFGRVRQVKFKNDPKGKVYALKMLKKTELVNLNQVTHIKSEKSILKSINHPFIVSLYVPAYSERALFRIRSTYICSWNMYLEASSSQG